MSHVYAPPVNKLDKYDHKPLQQKVRTPEIITPVLQPDGGSTVRKHPLIRGVVEENFGRETITYSDTTQVRTSKTN